MVLVNILLENLYHLGRAMRTIEEILNRSGEIGSRLDEIFQQIQHGDEYALTFEQAVEIITLIVEAKGLSEKIGFHKILTESNCSGPH